MIERNAASVVLRVQVFGEFRVERRTETGSWETVPASDWGKGTTSRQALKYLLSRGRMALRQDMVDALWEQSEPILAEDYLNKAIIKLRQAIHSERHGGLLQTLYNRTTYKLVDQARIWVDAEACEEALNKAERVGLTTNEGMRFLEQAAGYFAQGPLLIGEGGKWSHGWRGRLETARDRCLLWLIDGYIHYQEWRKAEAIAEQILQNDPLDENALGRLMHILHMQGLTSQALQRYHDTKVFCQRQQIPFPPMLDKLAERYQSQDSLQVTETFPFPSPSSNNTSTSFPTIPTSNNQRIFQKDILTSSPFNTTHAQYSSQPPSFYHIIETEDLQKREEYSMDYIRRQLLQQGIVGTTTFLPLSLFQQNILKDAKKALYRRTLALDDTSVSSIEQRIHLYWQERWNAMLSHSALIPHLIEYVRNITIFLDGSLLPSIRTRLCASLGQAMLLIGVSLYDMGHFQAAREYCHTAAEAAHEANNPTLQALAWGWNALAWSYSNEIDRYENALQSRLRATYFASLASDRAVQCWVQAGLAEVYAHLRNKEACLLALEKASKLEGCSNGDFYHIHLFDSSLLGGYRGVCLQQFYQSDAPDTHPLLEDAKQSLQDALSPVSIPTLREAFYEIDMAHIYARKGDIEPACTSALRIVDVVQISQSTSLQQRLHSLRAQLKPYADTSNVKELDVRLAPLLSFNTPH